MKRPAHPGGMMVMGGTGQPVVATVRLPLYLANRLVTYLDNLRSDALADQAGGLNQFTAEHQMVLAAVMQGIHGPAPAEAPEEEPVGMPGPEGQAPAAPPKGKPALAKPGPEAFKLGKPSISMVDPLTGNEGQATDADAEDVGGQADPAGVAD